MRKLIRWFTGARLGRVEFCDSCSSVCDARSRQRAAEDRLRTQALVAMRGSLWR